MQPTDTELPDVDLMPQGEKEHAVALLAKTREVLAEGQRYLIEIKDADGYARVVTYAQGIAGEIKELEAEQKKICGPLFTAHRNATSFFNRLLNPRRQIKEAAENAATRFRLEQDRLRRLEEERLAAIERARREMNDLHDAAFVAMNEHFAAFLRAWDEAVSLDADRTRQIEHEKEKAARLAHAQVAEDVGNKDGVSGILATPTPLAPAPMVISAPVAAAAPAAMMPAPDLTSPPPALVPVVPPPAPPPVTKVPPAGDPPAYVPTMKGVSQGMKWKFKIMSKRKFIEAVLGDHFGMDCITIEDGPMGPIGEKVRKQKGACVEEFKNYGIEVWPEADDKIRAL